MRSADVPRVLRNAQFHRNAAAHFFEQAGVEPPSDEPRAEQQQEKPAEGEEGASQRRSARRGESRPEQQPEEKPEEVVIAEMHLSAARQLEEVAETGRATAVRRALPAELRREATRAPRAERPTGVSPVKSGSPVR